MRLRDKFNNLHQDVKENFIKYSYIISPLMGLLLYRLLLKCEIINLGRDFNSNLIGIAGTMSGFLFTSLGVILAIPDNKFMEFLKSTGYTTIIYKSLIIGIMTLLASMVLGLFDISETMPTYLFIIGISETVLSAYYLYKVSYYSGKSK